MTRPQKPKIFEMDTEISTLDRKVGAYTIEHLPTEAVYHGSTIHLYRRVIEHQIVFMLGDEPCDVSYANRGGKYQGQTGVRLGHV